MDEPREDTRLLQALGDWAGLKPAQIAKRIGVAVSTINRPFSGAADYQLSRQTLAKLQEEWPDFPGWNRAGENRLPFKAQQPSEDMVQIAEIDLRFGLGGALMDQDVYEQHVETMGFPRAWVRYITDTPAKHLYWARGQGNSMEPNIGDGDVILIDRSQQTPGFGDLYWAIAYGQTGMIKRLRPMPDGSVKILSDNPHVPAEVAYDGELHVFGRVIAVVRRI